MDRVLKSEPVPDRAKICVWTLPEGSQPAVRVEVTSGKIAAKTLIGVVFDTLGIQENSRRFFGLFKGLDPPQKIFGDNEVIYLPCKSVVSLQKWSFDPVAEAKAIRSDTASIRLLALQINADIRSERLIPTLEQQQELEEYMDPDFPCYKQYVESARSIDRYGCVVIKHVKLVGNLRLKEETLKKGSMIDVVCGMRMLVIITERKELRIPWRKIRRWTQVSNYKQVSFEIYLMEQKAFTWIEMETVQAPYLLQVTSELVEMMKNSVQKPEFKKPAWAVNPVRRNKLTWKLFKKEMFGVGEDNEPEPNLDDLEHEEFASEDDDISITDLKEVKKINPKNKPQSSYAV